VTPHRNLVLLAAAQLTGCFYTYGNPAEDLRAGEARGTVLADPAGTGTFEPAAGVAISLKGAAFDQLSRPNGRFFILDLPAGQHRLLFRNGTTMTLERDIQISYGGDGQPEGLELGNVAMRATTAVEGSFALPAGITLAGGVAVDETSGQTAALGPGVVVPLNPTPPASFRFPALSMGTHVIKLSATDTFAGTWVGGQVSVNVTPADGGKTITLAGVAARVASASGHLRFRVQAIGLSLPPSSLTVNLTPNPGLNPITPASDGSVDVVVPEGLYTVTVVAPATATPLARLEPGALQSPMASLPAPVPTLSPPAAYGVVLDGRVAEVGSLYVASDVSRMASMTACLAAADCGTGATISCTSKVCIGYSPPSPPVTASTSYSASCTYTGATNRLGLGGPCQAGPNVIGACACPGGKSVDCAATAIPPVAGYCTPQACGFKCTPDGAVTATFTPVTGVCP
jgi:hypothetical protein